MKVLTLTISGLIGFAVGASAQQAYVPPPKPAKTDYLVGVHYFPGWKEGALRSVWAKIVPYPNRTPLLGYYDENNPEVTDWEIKWALENGISYFVYCWYRGRDNAGKPVTVDSLVLGHAIHEGLFHARYRDRFHFAFMWENQYGAGVSSLDDLINNLLRFWIDNYFKHPSYLKIDNKPVLFIYNFRNFIDNMGGEAGVRAAIEKMREVCRKEGFAGLTVLADSRSFDPQKIHDYGGDYVFSYGFLPGDELRPAPQQIIEGQAARLRKWRQSGFPFVPTAMMGWDPIPQQSDNPKTPWLNPDKMQRWVLAPEHYQILLDRVKTEMNLLPAGSLGRRMVVLSHWNEWGEGTYISPNASSGFGYLKAVHEVFTRRNNKPDYRSPFELGLGPYDSRFRERAAKPQ